MLAIWLGYTVMFWGAGAGGSRGAALLVTGVVGFGFAAAVVVVVVGASVVVVVVVVVVEVVEVVEVVVDVSTLAPPVPSLTSSSADVTALVEANDAAATASAAHHRVAFAVVRRMCLSPSIRHVLASSPHTSEVRPGRPPVRGRRPTPDLAPLGSGAATQLAPLACDVR
jgi:hypothetical protein